MKPYIPTKCKQYSIKLKQSYTTYIEIANSPKEALIQKLSFVNRFFIFLDIIQLSKTEFCLKYKAPLEEEIKENIYLISELYTCSSVAERSPD